MPTDIITYRYNERLVYVPVAPTYTLQLALSHARDAFPQLKGLGDASLSLSLTAPTSSPKFVGISAPAWPKLITHMSRYQIIDVHTHGGVALPIPDITITYADADVAPPYHGLDITDGEKVSHSAPRSSSASTVPKRSWVLQRIQGL